MGTTLKQQWAKLFVIKDVSEDFVQRHRTDWSGRRGLGICLGILRGFLQWHPQLRCKETGLQSIPETLAQFFFVSTFDSFIFILLTYA